MNLLFVGERRSPRAIQMGVTLRDGRLAGKQLFDALLAIGIDPNGCSFTNWFERGGKSSVRRHLESGGVIVAMGKLVQGALSEQGIKHVPIVHPAARGRIRLKRNYIRHVRTALEAA